jgi:hypothetical protein
VPALPGRNSIFVELQAHTAPRIHHHRHFFPWIRPRRTRCEFQP